ncbi:hypothetical protein EDC04DRAFT_2602363 [Pisolithus marmoratus]|nr:hypothetical protein EDC04DRAFT_2602363 [Pisolithus marmoratus]
MYFDALRRYSHVLYDIQQLGLVEIFPWYAEFHQSDLSSGGDSSEEDANEDTDEDDISANGDCDEEDQDQDQDQEEQTSDEASDYRDGVEADEDDEQCSLRGPGGICVPPVGLTAIVPSTSTIACSLLGFKQPGHRPLNSPFPKSVQQNFLEHVLKSHGISSVDKEFALPELPLAPIPDELALPFLIKLCGHMSTIAMVLRRPRLKKSRTQLTTCYIVQPYWGSMAATEPGASATILFHPDFQPHNKPLPPFLVTTSGPLSQTVPSDQLASMAAPVSAEWLQELGWGKWLSEVQADPEVLLPLIALPVSLHQLSTWDGHRLKLEIAILTIHRLFRGYLMDANSYIQDKHGDLRAHIHAGSRAHYNISYNAYCYPLSQTIALLLRTLYLEIMEDPLLHQLGKFPTLLTELTNTGAQENLLNLYEYITSDNSKDVLDPRKLLCHSHALAVSLIRCNLAKGKKVECPTDIVLILACVDIVEEAAMEDDEDEEVTEDLERDVEDGMVDDSPMHDEALKTSPIMPAN